MVCKTTCTKRRGAAFTLVELMIASGLAAIVVAGIISFILFAARSEAALDNYFTMDLQTQQAADNISRQIRQVQKLTGYTTTNLTFQDYDGGTLVYNYDPRAQTLKRIKGGVTDTLLTDCYNLQFSIFQRTPASNLFQPYSTKTSTNAKAIQLTWYCSRAASGGRANTESIGSGIVVIRNK